MTGHPVLALARPKFAIGVISALLVFAPASFAGTATQLSGSIAGFVRDARGIPQMGASVFLFNRSERLIQQAITNERGIFGFDALVPDLYSVRVSLASFVPAVKQKIAVQPGMQSLLYVDLASVLSSIELVYAAPGQGALMSDDWKWTLKASSSTRPVMRMLPDYSVSDPNPRDRASGGVFSDTRGLLNVSAGDPGSLGSASSQTDLGTAFALATSMFGRNQLKVSGNVGYSAGSATPTAGFRTSFSRDGLGPEIAVTVQQIYLPARQPDGMPALRTMSISLHDSSMLADNLRLEYGASLDSVSFLDHLNYLSKYARLSYDVGNRGTFQLAYSSGAPPVQLMAGRGPDSGSERGDTAALAQDLAALSLLPRVSLLDGRATVQRTQDLEFGYEKKFRSTSINFTGYRENVTNAAMTILAPDDAFAIGDVLPDISFRSSILDAGSFQRSGFATSLGQRLGDKVQVGASFGSTGGLSAGQQQLSAGTADELRSNLQTTQRFWASARASTKFPVTGTQITGSYQWMNYQSTIVPDHFYLTQDLYSGAGLNVLVRQPIPSLFGFPGRLEATAEVRNGLGQGYLPLIEGGQRVTLVQSPRALRGGLSFIF
jgi:hypothetical protein